jgi:hypothetical protein
MVEKKYSPLRHSAAEPQTESLNISRKDAKHVLSGVEGAAKLGQVRRYYSLRSWRLGAINFLALNDLNVWNYLNDQRDLTPMLSSVSIPRASRIPRRTV